MKDALGLKKEDVADLSVNEKVQGLQGDSKRTTGENQQTGKRGGNGYNASTCHQNHLVLPF